MNPQFAVFAKTDAARYAAAREYLQYHGLSRALYICPANRADDVRREIGCEVAAFEDLGKSGPYLRMHEAISDDTALILDGAIRYNKVSSSKFKPLHNLCRATTFKLALDIAPFYGDIRSIYFLFSYLNREIIGYQHWYAFRPNNMEEAFNGALIPAHDAELLAGKIAPHCRLAYGNLLSPNRQFVECKTTEDEAATYAERKADLFATRKTPGPIITRLADTAHAFASRMRAFLTLISRLDGKILVLTNLQSYAHRAGREAAQIGRPVTARSYYGDCSDSGGFDHIVYMESPIVNGYLLLDFEARAKESAGVWQIIGDAKVDNFLSSRIRDELYLMDSFSSTLWKIQNAA